MNFKKLFPLLLAVGATSACRYEEGLIIENLEGKVILPAQAATRTVTSFEGVTSEITDVRLIGPVYLGLFPSVEEAGVVEPYPHPSLGPQYIEGKPGDTFPYGGTTVGDFRYGCFEELTCRMTSGRFESFDGIVEWFNEIVDAPITDPSTGNKVTSGEFMRQTCYERLDVSSDADLRLTATEDRNKDGELDAKDLDFVWNPSTEEFEASFIIWQQEHFWDPNQEDCEPGVDCTGPTLWGYMDAPSNAYDYNSCDRANGYRDNDYGADYESGAPFADILNNPPISRGDWVSSNPFVWSNINDQPTLRIDFEVK